MNIIWTRQIIVTQLLGGRHTLPKMEFASIIAKTAVYFSTDTVQFVMTRRRLDSRTGVTRRIVTSLESISQTLSAQNALLRVVTQEMITSTAGANPGET